jgi:hypothetical protein
MNADTDDDAVTSLSLTHTGHSQSTMVQPLLKGSDKVQKRSKTFKKYQSDRFKRLQNVSIYCCLLIFCLGARRERSTTGVGVVRRWRTTLKASPTRPTRHVTSIATQTRMRGNAP